MAKMTKIQKMGIIISVVAIITTPFIVLSSWHNSAITREQYNILLSAEELLNRENSGNAYYLKAIKIYQNITTDFLLSEHLNNNYNLSDGSYVKYSSMLKEANSYIEMGEGVYKEEYSLVDKFYKNINEENNYSIIVNNLNQITYIVSISCFIILLVAYYYIYFLDDYFKKRKTHSSLDTLEKIEKADNKKQSHERKKTESHKKK